MLVSAVMSLHMIFQAQATKKGIKQVNCMSLKLKPFVHQRILQENEKTQDGENFYSSYLMRVFRIYKDSSIKKDK